MKPVTKNVHAINFTMRNKSTLMKELIFQCSRSTFVRSELHKLVNSSTEFEDLCYYTFYKHFFTKNYSRRMMKNMF